MQSFPWNSIATEIGEDGLPVYDRPYSADDLREVYETFFSNGVFLTQNGAAFQVSPGTGMKVLVEAGKCCIKGTIGWEKEQRELILQASSDLDRIDTVVLRWNANTEVRTIDLYVKTGVAAQSPKRPELTQNESIYELGLADIFITKDSSSVQAWLITDTRIDDYRCGIVTPLIDVDTTTFYDQLQAQTDVAVELANAALHDSMLGYFIDTVYPVGSFYMSMNPTNPHDLFGGTWTKLEDYYLRAGSDTDTGGSDTQTLSIDNLPSHSHAMAHTHGFAHTHGTTAHSHGTGNSITNQFVAFNRGGASGVTMGNTSGVVFHPTTTDSIKFATSTGTASPGTNSQSTTTTGGSSAANTGNRGSGQEFDIMPRYQNIHVWYRVA